MLHLMTRLRLILLLLPIVLLPTGCASSNNNSPSAGNIDSSGQPVSSVPWNKPEQWETTGQLGGMSGQ
jgi:outer membrane biogenesis lipoprotein LolB